MIQLNNIFKHYESKFQKNFILKDVSLTIEKGEFVTLMGPSGAGKSTLLNIIGLLDQEYEGEYIFLEENVNKLKEKRKAELHKNHIGFVFQAYHLIDELTVYENIETPLLYKDIKGSERQSMIADILDRFNMVAKKDLFPHQLSGGQQQLVGVARAIVGKPKLLLADEPTGKTLYEVFHYDNGPDYDSEGLIRVVKNGKIGYADAKTYRIVIAPQFTCAFPFENGKAKVSNKCKTIKEVEHSVWTSEAWQYVDKKGKLSTL